MESSKFCSICQWGSNWKLTIVRNFRSGSRTVSSERAVTSMRRLISRAWFYTRLSARPWFSFLTSTLSGRNTLLIAQSTGVPTIRRSETRCAIRLNWQLKSVIRHTIRLIASAATWMMIKTRTTACPTANELTLETLWGRQASRRL